ncbi:MAG TPA: VWA domain-containing protein [Bryobacteraceae bacterium]|nr:VWA domain-containing protein [Bryobacteraceae bacterium]
MGRAEARRQGRCPATRFLSGAAFRVAPLFLSVAFIAGAQTPEPPDKNFQISVDLNLVVLPVTVRDRNGGFASGLTKDNFDVYEDGAKQSIRLFQHEDIPVTAGIVVDHSGSMTAKMPDVVAAAEKFAALSNPQDQMFVVNFNEQTTLGLPSDVPFTHFATLLRDAIEDAPTAGETALYDALDLALDRLNAGKPSKKVLVVFSDGGDNASKTTLQEVLRRAARSNAIIYTIGIFSPDDPDQNAGVLKHLAKETGGEAFFPQAYKDAAEICARIAKDIRNQYTLGYISTDTNPGGYRRVKVVAHAPGRDLRVRTRAGYEAAP